MRAIRLELFSFVTARMFSAPETFSTPFQKPVEEYMSTFIEPIEVEIGKCGTRQKHSRARNKQRPLSVTVLCTFGPLN